MINRIRWTLIPGLLLLLLLSGCDGGGGSSSSSIEVPTTFDAKDFPPAGDMNHPYFPLMRGAGAKFVDEFQESTESVELFVSHETKVILGVECSILVSRTFLDGTITEESFESYAQDHDGNVWSFAENSTRFKSGAPIPVNNWIAGVDGIEPILFLKTQPEVGDKYVEEGDSGVPEEVVKITGLNIPVTLSSGETFLCVQTREAQTTERETQLKYYAQGIGLVFGESLTTLSRMELVKTTLDAEPEVNPDEFVDSIDNPYFPLEPGTEMFFEGDGPAGHMTIETFVTYDTKVVLGVSCTVVEENVYLDGILRESTNDWYAQDKAGTVWYFGEASKNYDEQGNESSDESWQAGKRGAYPGIIMPARPRIGDTHRQENAPGVGDELALIQENGVSIETPFGTLDGCIKTLEWSPLDGTTQLKYYAPSIGPVLESPIDGVPYFTLTDFRQ